jgi:hypothetical protein
MPRPLDEQQTPKFQVFVVHLFLLQTHSTPPSRVRMPSKSLRGRG